MYACNVTTNAIQRINSESRAAVCFINVHLDERGGLPNAYPRSSCCINEHLVSRVGPDRKWKDHQLIKRADAKTLAGVRLTLQRMTLSRVQGLAERDLELITPNYTRDREAQIKPQADGLISDCANR